MTSNTNTISIDGVLDVIHRVATVVESNGWFVDLVLVSGATVLMLGLAVSFALFLVSKT